jgi:hypothetical protein
MIKRRAITYVNAVVQPYLHLPLSLIPDAVGLHFLNRVKMLMCFIVLIIL